MRSDAMSASRMFRLLMFTWTSSPRADETLDAELFGRS